MDIEEMLEIHDCPLCDGGSLLEEESGCGYYVMCLDCGCHSVTIDFHSEEERLEAAKDVYKRQALCYSNNAGSKVRTARAESKRTVG